MELVTPPPHLILSMAAGSLTGLMIVILILSVSHKTIQVSQTFIDTIYQNYLTRLRESHHINCTQTRVPIISVDDVVVLKDDSTKLEVGSG